MESKTDSITLRVRPCGGKHWNRGLAELRKFKDGTSSTSGISAWYDPASKTWTLTVRPQLWQSLLATWGSAREALWIYRVEEAR